MGHREMQQCAVWRIFRSAGTTNAPKNVFPGAITSLRLCKNVGNDILNADIFC